MKYEILVFDLYSFFGTESKAVIDKTLLWERSLVFSLFTANNKPFLLTEKKKNKLYSIGVKFCRRKEMEI